MELTKEKLAKFATRIVTIALLLSAAWNILQYLQNSALHKEVTRAAGQVSQLTRERDDALNEFKDAREKLADMNSDLQSMKQADTELKSSVGAFATQAAACENIKRALNIKD